MVAAAVKANGTDNLNRDSFQSALSGEAAQIRRDGELAPFLLNLMAAHDDIIPWSEYPQARDRQLIKFAREESIFAGAQYAMETRIKNLEFKVTGSDRAMTYAEKLLDSGDGGRGLSSVIGKIMLAYDAQDNGWFVELVGAGDPDKPMIGRPLTYNFLDPACCYRTFDPDYPVFYRDPLTFKFHRIHATRIMFGASMPQTSATARGIGFCTLSRALRLLRVIHGITVYKEEKINGRFTRAIGYGKGITNTQLSAVMSATAETADSLGLTVYNGIPFFTTAQGIELNLLDLASVPDGFDTEKDTTLYVYALALAFGVDAREIWPASAAGATKADASVQHMKAQGKGIADRIATVEYLLTKGVLRGLDVTVEADFTDDEQDARRADMQKVRVDTFKTLVDMKALTGRQALALAVKEGIVNGDALATIEDVLVDIPEEKPQPAPIVPPQPAPNGQIPPQPANPAFPPPMDEAKKKALGIKAYSSTRDEFIEVIWGYIQDAQKDDINRRAFGARMRSALYDYGLQAFRDGMNDAGYDPESFSPFELQVYRDWQAQQSTFVTNFGAEIFQVGITAEEIFQRAVMWGNVSLGTIYYAGMGFGKKGKRYTWELGSTKEHCRSCLTNAGQTKTMDEWKVVGLPQSQELECHGFNCRCRLVPAD